MNKEVCRIKVLQLKNQLIQDSYFYTASGKLIQPQGLAQKGITTS